MSFKHNPRRPVGSDTREAMGHPALRLALIASLLSSGVAWMSVTGATVLIQRQVGAPLESAAWVFVGLCLVGLASAIAAWRAQSHSRLAFVLALVTAVVAALVAITRNESIATVGTVLTVPAVGYMIGANAQNLRSREPSHLAAAIGGITATFTILGIAVAGHLYLIYRSRGIVGVGYWSAAYLAVSAILMLLANTQTKSAQGQRVRDSRASLQHEALNIESVSLSFYGSSVLDRVSLVLKPGELLALVGQNGTGKSSLLRIASGLLKPDQGRVELNGLDITTLSAEERAQIGLAFASGANPVFPDLTVLENLRAVWSRRGIDSFKKATEAVFEAIPTLVSKSGVKAGVLSGGEQRLLALAQTLLLTPSCLLADELTIGLDSTARTNVLEILRHIADGGVAVLAVDHDLDTLLHVADTAALLVGGELSTYSPASSILGVDRELLPAEFLMKAVT